MSTSTSQPRARLTRSEQQARTRAALLDAAVEVFIERGLQGATIEAISERAGYTRGAFYSNFSTKEELFVELLQERVYRVYGELAQHWLESGQKPPSGRRSGEQLAAIQAKPGSAWVFRLWFELLAQTGRDPALRELAAGFWRGNRALSARLIERAAANRGEQLPVSADRLASAVIALDIGLAVQHHVDPEAVPLDAYPELFGALLDRPFS
jgi:AcrR family transcriptional regulator